jgi:prepilin-type N-terminal cleavage/methylation domain-containing protein
MCLKRSAFTLIEVLISIALFTLVLLALNKSVSLLRDSNHQLIGHLLKTKEENKIYNTLYLDVLGSDGNLTIEKDEFTRLCAEDTYNSLYGLPSAKVCWLVHKDKNTLLRVEGNNYTLPTTFSQHVEIDSLLEGIELFDIYHKDGKVLVLVKAKGKDPVSFMIQGVHTPVSKKGK